MIDILAPVFLILLGATLGTLVVVVNVLEDIRIELKRSRQDAQPNVDQKDGRSAAAE